MKIVENTYEASSLTLIVAILPWTSHQKEDLQLLQAIK